MGKFNLTELLNARSQQQGQQDTETVISEMEEEKPQLIDVYDLIPSKKNFYHVDDKLKRSIEMVGILQPLLISETENGKYNVIAGHRRRLAVLALLNEGKEKYRFVPCVFKKQNVQERLALIMANQFREKTDWEKMMEAIEAEELARDLKEEYKLQGRTRSILEEITGVSEAQLGRYKAIYNNLAPELMREFKENGIIFSVAVELCGLPQEWQQKALEKLENDGSINLQDAKELKKQEERSRNIPGQMNIEDMGQEEEEEIQEDIQQEEEDEDSTRQQAEEQQKAEEWEDPQPETIISLCYSCDRYEECHEKKSTVQKCNTYINRQETRKTEEQKYNEEQDRIDRETRRKLAERQQEEKMQNIPSDTEKAVKTHEIKIAAVYYEDVTSGKKTFELRKNDRGYKTGDKLHMLEFTAGKYTGRSINADIVYMLEEYTGLQEDYCILGISVTRFD